MDVRRYGPELARPALDLARVALGDGPLRPRTAGAWAWKHETNPFGPSEGLCAWDTRHRQVVALRLLLRWAFRAPSGREIPALRAVDTATHPSHRRRGWFRKLTARALAEAENEGRATFIFNTPNAQSLPGYRALGWCLVKRWGLLFLQAPGPATPVASPRSPEDLWSLCFTREVETWGAFARRAGPDLAALLVEGEGARPTLGLRTPRSPGFLQWRYGQHPYLPYGVCTLELGRELQAVVVLRANFRGGVTEVLMVELLLRRPDPILARRAIARALTMVQADYIVGHFSRGTVERRALVASGFQRRPGESIAFTTRLVSDAPAPSAWDLSLGDLEVF